jgi:uncharacterized membrane protein
MLILLIVGLILSLIGLTMWVAMSRGEQTQVNPEDFRLVFSLSILGSVVFSVLLIVAALRLRKMDETLVYGVKFYPIFVQHMLAGTSSACA